MPAKRYFCVDESGQDTKGQFFIVAIVISEQDADHLRMACLEIERLSRKGTRKWMRTSPERRLEYVHLVLQKQSLAGRLTFAHYSGRTDYEALTCHAVALAVMQSTRDVDNIVFIDGLPKRQWVAYGRQIRQWGARIEKVRGTRRDENDALIRLADAICGFVRGAHEGQPKIKALFELALGQGFLVDLEG